MNREGSKTADIATTSECVVFDKLHLLSPKSSLFDSSCLFSYMEGDIYTRSFAKITPDSNSNASPKESDENQLKTTVESSKRTSVDYEENGVTKGVDEMDADACKKVAESAHDLIPNSVHFSSSTTIPHVIMSPIATAYYPAPFISSASTSAPDHFYQASSTPLQPVSYAPCRYYPMIPAPTFYSPQLTHSGEGVAMHLIEDIEKTLSDQSSCRMVQKYLEDTKSPAMVSKLFIKMFRKIGEFMNTPFGNYLCQKLFELLSEFQLKSVISSIKGQTVEICNNLHGTRSIQKLIECAVKYPKLETGIVKLIQGNVCELSKVCCFRCVRVRL